MLAIQTLVTATETLPICREHSFATMDGLPERLENGTSSKGCPLRFDVTARGALSDLAITCNHSAERLHL